MPLPEPLKPHTALRIAHDPCYSWLGNYIRRFVACWWYRSTRCATTTRRTLRVLGAVLGLFDYWVLSNTFSTPPFTENKTMTLFFILIFVALLAILLQTRKVPVKPPYEPPVQAPTMVSWPFPSGKKP